MSVQRPPAERAHAAELQALSRADTAPRPPGWRLSMPAVRRFILGGQGSPRKFYGSPALIERAMVTLATDQALLLIGPPGTAKSLLSELLAAAISACSTLLLQGGAATEVEQIKYTWNYARLLAEGPSRAALVPGPLLTAMEQGVIVRFEELTRCPVAVQDALLSPLSERVLGIPELPGSAGLVYAAPGFNLIATANTADQGVNRMSAALRRRMCVETIFPIADLPTEQALVAQETQRLLARANITALPERRMLQALVETFRDLRRGHTEDGAPVDRIAISTAETVRAAHALGVRSHYLSGGQATAADLIACMQSALRASQEERLWRYLARQARAHDDPLWTALAAALDRDE